MNTYSMRKPRSFDWAKAFLVSVAVHILLILLWAGAILLEVFVTATRDLVEEIKEDQYVTMPVEILEAFEESRTQPEPKPAEPEAPEKRFVPTRPNQESPENIKSSRYFGERNTAAASSGEAVENGLEVPSQDGRDTLFENDIEVANSEFSDNDIEGAPGLPGEPQPLSPTNLTSQPQPDQTENKPTEPNETIPETPVFEPTEVTGPTTEQRMARARAKAAELLALDESIPVTKEEEEETPDPEKEKPAEEQIPRPKPSSLTGGVTGNRGLESGYDREARRTRMSGTIRRRGENSLQVEDSVKGRFMAKVNKEIEKAWQRECILRREFILPGVLSISFSIDKEGRVTGFRFDSRIAGGAIQEGFTMRAIQKAKLPAMPKEMIDELSGEQLELNLTFMF